MSPVHMGGAPSSAEALTGHADATGPVKRDGHCLGGAPSSAEALIAASEPRLAGLAECFAALCSVFDAALSMA